MCTLDGRYSLAFRENSRCLIFKAPANDQRMPTDCSKLVKMTLTEEFLTTQSPKISHAHPSKYRPSASLQLEQQSKTGDKKKNVAGSLRQFQRQIKISCPHSYQTTHTHTLSNNYQSAKRNNVVTREKPVQRQSTHPAGVRTRVRVLTYISWVDS